MRFRGTSRFSRLKSIQAGFTFVSLAVSVTLASIVMLGGYVAFRDIQMQWRVSNAERQMDQYAQNAMAELVNVLSWAYGAEQLQSGNNPKWRFALMEQVRENAGQSGQGLLSYRYTTDQYYLLRQTNGGRVELTYDRDRGILFDRRAPKWMEETAGRNSQYVWSGRQVPDNRDVVGAFDRRDRMQMTSFEVELPLSDQSEMGANNVNIHGLIEITITMQYRYNGSATSNTTRAISIFSREYIRERTYSTKILMRNWDVDQNLFRDDLQGLPGL